MNSKTLLLLHLHIITLFHYCSSKFSGGNGIEFIRNLQKSVIINDPDSTDSVPRDFSPQPFFALIGFGENSQCSTEYGIGKCFAFSDCSKNGQHIGSCLWGLGSCCSSNMYCVADSSRRSVSRTTAVLTINPYLDIRNCNFDFPKQSGICQLRIDFEEFNLMPANEFGFCTDEKLTIRGSITVDEMFELCGDVGKSHIYLSYGNSDKITISIQTLPNPDFGRLQKYKLKIKQIQCDSLERVSDQCLQNYNDPKGKITSFGFPNFMISKHKYSICIQSNQLQNTRQIKWKECESSNQPNNFLLSKHFSNLNGNLRLPVIGAACNDTSYVEVVGENKHCGAEFQRNGKLVTSSFRPYELKVNFITDTLPPPIIIFPSNGLEQDSTICPFLLPDIIEQPVPEIGIYRCAGAYSRIFSGTMWCPLGEEECKIKTHCVCAIFKGSPIPETNVKPVGFCLDYSVI